jgi:hypothetical protein
LDKKFWNKLISLELNTILDYHLILLQDPKTITALVPNLNKVLDLNQSKQIVEFSKDGHATKAK